MKKRVKEILKELSKLEAAKQALIAEWHVIQSTCKHDYSIGAYVCKHCHHDCE